MVLNENPGSDYDHKLETNCEMTAFCFCFYTTAPSLCDNTMQYLVVRQVLVPYCCTDDRNVNYEISVSLPLFYSISYGAEFQVYHFLLFDLRP